MDDILIGKGDKEVYLLPKYAHRHGMIAGAPGTGNSVSLLLAEGFSKLGVPVFLSDFVRNGGGQPGRSILRGVLGSMRR